jgi:pimeloyl-ACP methyl ester carboxylesterase
MCISQYDHGKFCRITRYLLVGSHLFPADAAHADTGFHLCKKRKSMPNYYRSRQHFINRKIPETDKMSEEMCEIQYFSPADQSMQPAFFAPASGSQPRPLVVALHTWSYDRFQGYEEFFAAAARRNWHCIFPEFRGPNWQHDACGSDLVVSDLAAAVTYVKENYPVDNDRVFIVGGSGGGHASLLMAGRCPELWTAVSSWCPISDVAKWHDFCAVCGHDGEYAEHIRSACGGNPAEDPAVYADAMRRSPVTYLPEAVDKVVVDISTGIHDGHRGSVPVSHSLEAFNLLADPADRFTAEEIEYMCREEAVPEHLRFNGTDPAFGKNIVLCRRQSNSARLTIFEGGHQILCDAAFGFFDHQCRHQPPVWFSGENTQSNSSELSR